MDPTVHGYSLTARKPAAGVGATCGFVGTTPSRVASMRAYASSASDLSAVSKAPFFEVVMRFYFDVQRGLGNSNRTAGLSRCGVVLRDRDACKTRSGVDLQRSSLFEIASVFVRFDHIASIIVNVNHSDPRFGSWRTPNE